MKVESIAGEHTLIAVVVKKYFVQCCTVWGSKNRTRSTFMPVNAFDIITGSTNTKISVQHARDCNFKISIYNDSNVLIYN